MTERRSGRWLQRFRERHFSQHPLCVHCLAKGRVTVATQLDHKRALTNGGRDFDGDPENAQGLCDACHEAKTREDLGQRKKVTIGLDGWPVE